MLSKTRILNVEGMSHLKFLIIFLASYLINRLILNFIGIKMISAINLNWFSFWLSLINVATLSLLEEDPLKMNLKATLIFHSKRTIALCLILLIGITSLFFIFSEDLSQTAFIEWNKLSPFSLILFLIVFSIALYGPAYIIHTTLLRKYKWNIIERITLYPVLSTTIFAPLTVICNLVDMNIPDKTITTILLIMILIIFLNKQDFDASSLKSQKLDIDLKKILVFLAIIGFNLFISYSAIGDENAFLRGDMWGDAHRIAFLNKYRFNAYSSSPVEDYPQFYHLFWSAITRVTLLPFINGLILIALFNHLYSILAFYLLSRILFKNSKISLFSVIIWTTLSGFSWIYLILNPPTSILSGNELLEYISSASQQFGRYSGAIVSPIYADDHTLTRLWALILFFISIAVLLKSYFNENNNGGELLIFILSFIQILLGHIIEAPLIALVLFLLILIGRSNPKFIRSIFFASLMLSIASAFLVILIFGLNSIYILISITPFLAVVFALSLSIIFKNFYQISIKNKMENISYKIRTPLSILVLYAYSLMLLAFFSFISQIKIHYPITTLWFSPAIEWGFTGFISILTVVLCGVKRKKMEFGLNFAILMLLLQLFLLLGLNYFNYNFFYIQTPYPIQPILFLPFLALISSHFFSFIKPKNKALFKGKGLAIIFLIIIVFSIGSIDHILSASYWKTNNGWWTNKPLNPSSEDYELINFLYSHPRISCYEFIGTFYDWSIPSSYVVYPSGMATLSQPLIDILSRTNDSREIFLLTTILPINYVLISKQQSLPLSYLSYSVNNSSPVFSNSKYKVYSISKLNLSRTDLLPSSSDFIAVTKIDFEGNITLVDKSIGKMDLKAVVGEISPVEEGKIIIKVNPSLSYIKHEIIAFSPLIEVEGKLILYNLKSTWSFFKEIKCSADKLIISGKISFKIFNTFKERIYMEKLDYEGEYQAFPYPTYLRPDYSKKQIEHYLEVNYVNPIEVITTPYGITLTSITIVNLIIVGLRFKLKVKVKK